MICVSFKTLNLGRYTRQGRLALKEPCDTSQASACDYGPLGHQRLDRRRLLRVLLVVEGLLCQTFAHFVAVVSRLRGTSALTQV